MFSLPISTMSENFTFHQSELGSIYEYLKTLLCAHLLNIEKFLTENTSIFNKEKTNKKKTLTIEALYMKINKRS